MNDASLPNVLIEAREMNLMEMIEEFKKIYDGVRTKRDFYNIPPHITMRTYMKLNEDNTMEFYYVNNNDFKFITKIDLNKLEGGE